ncbi:unnamed protein product [Trichogramma brassicae]|uniref:Phosphatidate cytidylyltransferase, mitochondrial n=1 Tax=Trichogramma brassicae TaxID=86971 RepID=A0A6H5IXP5_9HYME|nr:unnamed protein product [Trichogramma brassicae]
MIDKVSQLRSVLRDFPRSMKFCFAYGSGVLKQKSDPSSNMLDLIFVVSNPYNWHAENMIKNRHHYAQPLKFFGHKAVARVQESWGAEIYYNTLVTTAEGRNIKYGVVSEVSLVEDLLDWNKLYLAGRLHKPVEVIQEPEKSSPIRTALIQNLHSAVHVALLLLPEHFTEDQFFMTIAGLSYHGDFRMIIGEDKDKISNIVKPQMKNFRELYAPILKNFDPFIDFPLGSNGEITCRQDTSSVTKVHHFNQIPKTPQMMLVKNWSAGPRSQDTEDCLRAIANDPDSDELLSLCLRKIVMHSSLTQSLKGIVTAGLGKSIRYSGKKLSKMMSSLKNKKLLPPSDFSLKTSNVQKIAREKAPLKLSNSDKTSEKQV